MSENPSQDKISIGPFDLIEIVGQAGMGEVWRGVHREQGVKVAVKVLTQEGSRDPLYLSCLRNEVHRVAALDHPGIVRMYDHGILPDHLSHRGLASGSPYLVMEFAEGGTLSRHCGKMDWLQSGRVLLRLLDALAHAHARGVVHRDIKPGNVLFRRTSGGVLLTDFGLARAGDTQGGALLNAGTPAYMAPEQILAKSRDIGPWTDLYAVGCLAYSLLCGHPPYYEGELKDMLEAHLDAPIPDLKGVTEVPDGVNEWVGNLMRKQSGERFCRAADAAHALREIIGAADEEENFYLEPVLNTEGCEEADSPNTGLHTLTGAVPSLGDRAEDTQVMDLRPGEAGSARPGPMPAVQSPVLVADQFELPPLPEDWTKEGSLRKRVQLLGTGLGMYGLRSLPLIGRDKERGHLWSVLSEVLETGSTRAVMIEGDDGAGKTHLSEWLARRAHEVGAVTCLRTKVRVGGGDGDELLELIHGLLGTAGLNRRDARDRVRECLEALGGTDADEVDALVSMLGPFPDDPRSHVEGKDHHAIRRFVIRRLLHRYSAVRPLLVLLDEAHWSDDVVNFTQCMLSRTTTDHPVMLVLTACPWMAEGDAEQSLDNLVDMDDVSRIHIGPLEPEHRSVLVRELLGLDPSLAAVVERRSGGNPQFAIQLVGDWVQKGMLRAGEHGFKMRAGVTPDFPADLQAVWERRLAAALPPEKDIRSLQMAAAVGLDIEVDWWNEACAEMGIEPDWDLIEALEAAHLVIVKPGRRSWTFTHTLVAEALRRQADFRGTLKELNRAVARMLEARDDPSLSPKLGRHLLRAGELERGIDVLLEGANECWRTCRFDRGWDLLEQRETALRRLRVPRSDLRWHRGWLAQAQLHRHRKEFEVAMSLYKRVLKRAEGDPTESELVGDALLGVGSIYRLRAEPVKARDYLKRTLALEGLSSGSRASAYSQLATLEVAYGNLSLATDYFEDALGQAELSGDEDMTHKVKGDLAGVYRRRGETKVARRYLEEAVRYYEKRGQRRRLSGVLNDLAEIDRISGNIDIAEQGYRRALEILESLGDQAFFVARLNLGIIYSESGRTVEAREELEPCVDALRRTGLVGIEGVTHLVLAHVEAQEGNFDAWDRAFEMGSKLVRDTGFVDVDVARTTQKAGEVLLAADESDRARMSLSLARDHWDLLEWNEKAAEIADLLEELNA